MEAVKQEPAPRQEDPARQAKRQEKEKILRLMSIMCSLACEAARRDLLTSPGMFKDAAIQVFPFAGGSISAISAAAHKADGTVVAWGSGTKGGSSTPIGGSYLNGMGVVGGAGGGGGAPTRSTTGIGVTGSGTGGDGGYPGGGGGGGGALLNTSANTALTTGKAGDGADGYVVVITYGGV